jgi:hypothetical protein
MTGVLFVAIGVIVGVPVGSGFDVDWRRNELAGAFPYCSRLVAVLAALSGVFVGAGDESSFSLLKLIEGPITSRGMVSKSARKE